MYPSLDPKYVYEFCTLALIIISLFSGKQIYSLISQIAKEGWQKTGLNGGASVLLIWMIRKSLQRVLQQTLKQLLGDMTPEELAEVSMKSILSKEMLIGIPLGIFKFLWHFSWNFVFDLLEVIKDIHDSIYRFIEYWADWVLEWVHWAWDWIVKNLGEFVYFFYDKFCWVVQTIGETLGYPMEYVMDMIRAAGRFVLVKRDDLYQALVEWYGQGNSHLKFFFLFFVASVLFTLFATLLWRLSWALFNWVMDKEWYLPFISSRKLTGSI